MILPLCSCRANHSSSLYIESGIAAELKQVRAIDNHAHPQKVVSAGEVDRDFDALPADAIQEPALPTPLLAGSPYFPEAWRTLFKYPFNDEAPAHLKVLQKEKQDTMREKGDLYPVWVLNRADTDIMLANRVAMGRGLSPDRFKWVPFVDMFLFPLNNASIKAKDPEHKSFLDNEEKLLHGYMQAANLARLPSTLDDYLTFLSHQLESWKSQGAVALKFELAYLRDLQISNPQKENAERVYAIYAQSSEPTPEEYKMLQDYLFRYIAHEAARLNVPIHIHTSIGVGSYFRDENANPFALESVFNDPSLRRTKFVMLHGSWPFAREAAASILKPNVYLDYSGFSYWTYPVEAARALRLYLEAAPEKVLYGTDGSPFSESIGWEETTWIAAQNGRLSLGLALTGMLNDREITEPRAIQLVHMVLRENARTLYRF
ncbi:MAG TPA: amidohydrolase family protein [Bryobacteraceae bacterium]|nr:amidohydrolase family protein [Bryobacteraceae bacterium]